jgi:hypothetical protein
MLPEVRTVPPATAVKTDTQPVYDYRSAPRSVPSSEDAPYEPRYRVVARKPLVAARRRSAARRSHPPLLLVAIPGVCLLAYVLFWTLAMRGGYYRDQIRAEIKTLQIEQAELEAEKRRLQSPGFILHRAAEIGMQRAEQREFAQLPAPQQVARHTVER